MKATALSPHSAAVIALERRYGLDPFPPMPDRSYWWPVWYIDSISERQRWAGGDGAGEDAVNKEGFKIGDRVQSGPQAELCRQLDLTGYVYETEYKLSNGRLHRWDIRVSGRYSDGGRSGEIIPGVLLIDVQGGGWGKQVVCRICHTPVTRIVNNQHGGSHIVPVREGGHHSRAGGMADDCEKLALAVIAGHRVLLVTPAQIASGQALKWIEEVLGK